jgi:FkbM family methyltransferase
MKLLVLKLRAWGRIFRNFRNPFMVSALRLGWYRLPLFNYRITKGKACYEMLARPAAIDHSDLSILRSVLVEEEYGELLPLLPAGPLRIVDIGANLGAFTLWLERQRGLGEAFCFEPDPGSFNLCRFNLAHNRCPAARVIPKAVGGQGREIEMYVNSARPGSVTIYGQPSSPAAEKCHVEVVAFGEWLKTVTGDFDVLKMDCEGAEWEIFRHTPPEQFRRFRRIIAEVHGDPAQPPASIAEFRRLAEAAGFTTVRDDNHVHGLYLGIRK